MGNFINKQSNIGNNTHIFNKVYTTKLNDGENEVSIADLTSDSTKPTDIYDYIVESYRNGYSWYEIYKSGKIRQGGKCAAGQAITSIALYIPFENTNYSVFSAGAGDGVYYAGRNYVALNKTTTKFDCAQGYNTGVTAAAFWDCANYWIAEG